MQVERVRPTNSGTRVDRDLDGGVRRQGEHRAGWKKLLSSFSTTENLEQYRDTGRNIGGIVDEEYLGG